MVKRATKSKRAAKPKATKKTQKIQKTKTAKRGGNNPTNPKKAKGRGRARQTPGNVRFYTVKEDAQILEALRLKDQKTTKSQLATDLSNDMGRSFESVRDRIKRYMEKLSSTDTKEILKQAKKNPNYYVYFKGKDGNKKIDQVNKEEPLIYNRELVRKPRVSQKPKKQARAKKVSFDWILRKVRASDPYFALDHSVHLLNAVFGRLMEEGVTRREVENFVANSEGEVTLYEVLNALAKK